MVVVQGLGQDCAAESEIVIITSMHISAIDCKAFQAAPKM